MHLMGKACSPVKRCCIGWECITSGPQALHAVQGRNGAISVIALAERGALFDPGPCMYMEKLAGAQLFTGPSCLAGCHATQRMFS